MLLDWIPMLEVRFIYNKYILIETHDADPENIFFQSPKLWAFSSPARAP